MTLIQAGSSNRRLCSLVNGKPASSQHPVSWRILCALLRVFGLWLEGACATHRRGAASEGLARERVIAFRRRRVTHQSGSLLARNAQYCLSSSLSDRLVCPGFEGIELTVDESSCVTRWSIVDSRNELPKGSHTRTQMSWLSAQIQRSFREWFVFISLLGWHF